MRSKQHSTDRRARFDAPRPFAKRCNAPWCRWRQDCTPANAISSAKRFRDCRSRSALRFRIAHSPAKCSSPAPCAISWLVRASGLPKAVWPPSAVSASGNFSPSPPRESVPFRNLGKPTRFLGKRARPCPVAVLDVNEERDRVSAAGRRVDEPFVRENVLALLRFEFLLRLRAVGMLDGVGV